MSRMKKMLLAIVVVAVPMLSITSDANAGPLLDWIRGCRKPSCLTRKAANNTCYSPQVASAAPNALGLQPGQCMKTCNQTCSRTVVNYVPYTAYRTDWKQVPVTSYKPVTNSDPCTGCTVTCMRPCTTYTYQMQRVPYTTYRPEYRTENYTVPVTTITNDCATGTCGMPDASCSTCGTGNPMPPSYPISPAPVTSTGPTFNAPNTNYGPVQPNVNPNGNLNGTYYEYPATNPPTSMNTPGGTISTEGIFNTSTPADFSPSLNGINPQSSARPVLDQLRSTQPTPATYSEPKYSEPTYAPQTAQSPARQEWSYSPVRLASYTSTSRDDDQPRLMQPVRRTVESSEEVQGLRVRGRLQSESIKPVVQYTTQHRDLNGWVEVK